MNESELVEGAEYEGVGAASGLLCRGVFRGERRNTIDGRDAVTLHGALAANAQKLVSGSVGPPSLVDWNKTCCQCGCARDDHDPRCSYFKPKQSEPERPTCDECGRPALNLLLDRCGACGITGTALRVRRSTNPNANDLAWTIRRETLAAEERKRWHYEERCKAYARQGGDQIVSRNGSPPSLDMLAAYGHELDAAIARVKPTERDEPAYVMPQWPCDAGEEYEL